MDFLSPITTAMTNAAMQAKQWPSKLADYEQQRLSQQGNWNPREQPQQVNNGMDLSALSALISGMNTGQSAAPAAPTFNVSYGGGGNGGGSSIPAMNTNYNLGTGGGTGGGGATTPATKPNLAFSGWGDSYLTNSNYSANPFGNNAFANSQTNNPYYTGLH